MKTNLKTRDEVELMDMLDEGKSFDSLSEEELTQMDDAKLAMMALQAWEEAEPIQAREDFWPKLREKLPERPPRSPWKRAVAGLGAWVWPAHSPMMASMRVAVLVTILALASFWFAPDRANQSLMATEYSPEETAFIQRSLKQHDKYVTTGPSDGGLEIPAGDASSADAAESDPSDEYVP